MSTIVNNTQNTTRILDSSGNSINTTGNALDVNLNSVSDSASKSKTVTIYNNVNLTGGGNHFSADVDIRDCSNVSIYGSLTESAVISVYYKTANETTTLTNTIISNYSYTKTGAGYFVLDIPSISCPWLVVHISTDQTAATVHVSCKP